MSDAKSRPRRSARINYAEDSAIESNASDVATSSDNGTQSKKKQSKEKNKSSNRKRSADVGTTSDDGLGTSINTSVDSGVSNAKKTKKAATKRKDEASNILSIDEPSTSAVPIKESKTRKRAKKKVVVETDSEYTDKNEEFDEEDFSLSEEDFSLSEDEFIPPTKAPKKRKSNTGNSNKKSNKQSSQKKNDKVDKPLIAKRSLTKPWRPPTNTSVAMDTSVSEMEKHLDKNEMAIVNVMLKMYGVGPKKENDENTPGTSTQTKIKETEKEVKLSDVATNSELRSFGSLTVEPKKCLQTSQVDKSKILDMLKEHEAVEEMSDSSSDDDDDGVSKEEKKDKTVKDESSDVIKDPGKGKRKATTKGRKTNGKRKPQRSSGSVESEDESDSDDDQWEVVETMARSEEYKRPENVTVILKNEDFLPSRKKQDFETVMMRYINRKRKKMQLLFHHAHLVCLLAYQRYVNKILSNDVLKAVAYSMLPVQFHEAAKFRKNRVFAEKLLSLYSGMIKLNTSSAPKEFDISFLCKQIQLALMSRSVDCPVIYMFTLLVFFRCLNFKTRLCISHRPISYKPALLKKDKDGVMMSHRGKPKPGEAQDDLTGPMDYFIEVFLEEKKSWRAINLEDMSIVDDCYEMTAKMDVPTIYVIACNEDGKLKDLSSKYCLNWLSFGIKMRPPKDNFLEETLAPFLPNEEIEEEKCEQQELIAKREKDPLPTTVNGCKNHPLYVLARHLLKFEALYPPPPDTPTLGFIRGEAVYSRESVQLLRSRETWNRFGRQVKEGEEAYKIVKARPKYDRLSDKLITDLPLEVFGIWQTEPFKPPVAVDGKVPRNKFGNVELFHECMLPIGCCHLKLPGVLKIASKLGIDCAPAVVGFEGVARGCHPVYEGFVVCEEFKETLIAAWDEMEAHTREKQREKSRVRARKNWRKLYRGVICEMKLKKKYLRE